MSIARTATFVVLLAGLGGCSYADLHVGDDFGQAYRQSIASQIADPDARYGGTPAPGSDGARVALAQDRYRTSEVTPLQAASTSMVTAPAAGQ